ncbi:hypothetical protein V6Z11_D02G071700 [Gossypium hirsutum]
MEGTPARRLRRKVQESWKRRTCAEGRVATFAAACKGEIAAAATRVFDF